MSRDDIERQLWAQAWVAVAGSANCTKVIIPTAWADEAVRQYRARYPEAPPTDGGTDGQ